MVKYGENTAFCGVFFMQKKPELATVLVFNYF